ncbi:hypothetical protein H2248_012490 [Termitomyces sp. 'cryptogamus']|nr:hypothetical protein H2248_012490 [Termitomyces sp. 'cryptogamus']
MYNLLRTTALILISTLFATSASAQELKPGELCAGFAGPVGARAIMSAATSRLTTQCTYPALHDDSPQF